MSVKGSTRAALETAMLRLLEGKSLYTDGALTVVNLAKEASVGRATANRATDIIKRFQAAVEARKDAAERDAEQVRPGINPDVNVREERRALRALASQVTVLTIALRETEKEVTRLTAALAEERAARSDGKVVVMRRGGKMPVG